MKGGIYRIVHVASGKVYVGSSTDIGKRLRQHKDDLKAGRHRNQRLQRAWAKYGPAAFAFEPLEPVADVTTLLRIEQHWIDLYDAVNVRHGFNLKPLAGRTAGFKWSRASRDAQSKRYEGRRLTAEHKANIGKGQLGQRRPTVGAKRRAWWAGLTDEQRRVIAERISVAQRGRPVSDEKRKQISKTLTGKKLSTSHRAAVGDALRGIKRPEWSARMRSGQWRTRLGMRKAARAADPK